MKCFRCGARVPEETRFCGHCGTKLTDPQAETVADAPADGDELLSRIQRIFSGEYTIEGEVGRGGMAVVYKATENDLGRVVALKVLPPEIGITPKAVERFKREARLVADIEHPNIIPVYRAGQLGGILHIVMKYVDGVTLEALLERHGPLPVPVALSVLGAAMRALSHAHERDIVHRDVKSANIMIDRGGSVLVSDFGVALRASDVTLTQAGMIIGTPAFMSPEQCAGQRALPQSDQYSLGILAFQMLAGAVPFSADTLAGLMQHHFFTLHPDLHRVRDDVPPALVELINRALSKSPTDRFSTTREMMATLGAIPLGEEERRASADILKAAVRGEPFHRIITRELPALPEAPTLIGVALPASIRGRERVLRWALGGAGALAAVLAGVMLWPLDVARPISAAPEQELVAPAPATATAAATVPRQPTAPPPAPAPPPGALRLLTHPASATIEVDGVRAGVGSLYDHPVPSGNRRISVRAAGYQSFDSTVVLRPGETINLRLITLTPLEDTT